MFEWLRFAVVAHCVLAGLVAMCVGVLGTYRFRFVLNRMHAAGMLDTSGLLFLSLGLAVACGWSVTSAKLLLAVLIQWCTSPVSSHLIGRLVIFSEEKLEKYMEVKEQ